MLNIHKVISSAELYNSCRRPGFNMRPALHWIIAALSPFALTLGTAHKSCKRLLFIHLKPLVKASSATVVIRHRIF